jgi:hypothetical protein
VAREIPFSTANLCARFLNSSGHLEKASVQKAQGVKLQKILAGDEESDFFVGTQFATKRLLAGSSYRH